MCFRVLLLPPFLSLDMPALSPPPSSPSLVMLSTANCPPTEKTMRADSQVLQAQRANLAFRVAQREQVAVELRTVKPISLYWHYQEPLKVCAGCARGNGGQSGAPACGGVRRQVRNPASGGEPTAQRQQGGRGVELLKRGAEGKAAAAAGSQQRKGQRFVRRRAVTHRSDAQGGALIGGLRRGAGRRGRGLVATG